MPLHRRTSGQRGSPSSPLFCRVGEMWSIILNKGLGKKLNMMDQSALGPALGPKDQEGAKGLPVGA